MNNIHTGETVQTDVKILKVKKNTVTVVEIDDKRYVLDHKDNHKTKKAGK